ncbi:MAG: DUF3618 domain-containing protein [Solirubrobacteraceae bacterium]|nr:DUF3618 domain-containing protein [Solirubrobacteraceae bacterium]
MAKKTTKGSARESDTLSVPGAVAEMARGYATAKALRPDPHASDAEKAAAEKEAPPARSRTELKADIAATRAQLADVVDQIESHLDVPTRAKEIAGDFRADPIAAAQQHKRTAGVAVVAVAGLVTAAVLIVRGLRR